MKTVNSAFKFHGGVHPQYNKDLAAAKPIEAMPLPKQLVVSMSQHLGAPAKCLVKKGDAVVKGQLIGERNGFISVPVHAPVAGTVAAVEQRMGPAGGWADAVILDVREEEELVAFEIPGAVNIPLGQLRGRLGELDPSRKYVVLCTVGVRSYNGARILMQNGFTDVLVYPAGTRLYRILHEQREDETAEAVIEMEEKGGASTSTSGVGSGVAGTPERSDNSMEMKKVTLNCDGLQCPGPIMEVFKTIKEMKDGELLEVSASDPGFSKDIASWCRRTGNTMVSNEKRGNSYVAVLQKGISTSGVEESSAGADLVSASEAGGSTPALPQGKTIIVFDGELDKVLASFVIANGALAMGRPVTMFFTFWGLTALRKTEKQKLKKSPVEKMFGTMLPRGTKELGLSRMNMGGMGTKMMRAIMKDKNIDSLEDMMKKAMENGVRIVACSMSMDVMGIRKEELIDGVEIGGVGTYLADAEESNVNLFI